MHQYKPTQIDKSTSVLVALKWVEHAIKFIYEAVCNNVFAEENCFFYETENDLLGSGRLLYSFAPDHCASLNHADRKFYLFNISSTWSSGRCDLPKSSLEGCTTLWRKSLRLKFFVGCKSG